MKLYTKYKKIVFTIAQKVANFSILLFLVAFPYILNATDVVGHDSGSTGLKNPLKSPDLYEFVRAILTVVRNIGFYVAIFFIVYSGFLFVTASGDETKLKTAKTTFLWTIIGTAVLLGAWVFAVAIEGTIVQLR